MIRSYEFANCLIVCCPFDPGLDSSEPDVASVVDVAAQQGGNCRMRSSAPYVTVYVCVRNTSGRVRSGPMSLIT